MKCVMMAMKARSARNQSIIAIENVKTPYARNAIIEAACAIDEQPKIAAQRNVPPHHHGGRDALAEAEATRREAADEGAGKIK